MSFNNTDLYEEQTKLIIIYLPLSGLMCAGLSDQRLHFNVRGLSRKLAHAIYRDFFKLKKFKISLEKF